MDVQIYKNREYLNNCPSWHTEDSAWKAKKIYNIILKNQIQFNQIAEIGCGAGMILENLSQHIKDSSVMFYGYDISPQAIEKANQIQNKRIKFNLCDLTENEECYYDVLLAIDVIEHIPDYLTFLERCKLKARYKIYHIPLDIHVSSVLRNAFVPTRYTIGHLHYFTYESAIAVLKDTGHKIIDVCYTNGAIGLFKQHPTVKKAIANIPRFLLSIINTPMAARVLGGYSLLVLAK